MSAATVVRTIEVAVSPEIAFEVFTEEIGEWYRSGPYSWNDPARAIGIRFEPGVGGRLVEVWKDAGREGYDMGRILAWEPDVRLVFEFRNAHLPPVPTQVEVRLEPRRRRHPGHTRAPRPRPAAGRGRGAYGALCLDRVHEVVRRVCRRARPRFVIAAGTLAALRLVGRAEGAGDAALSASIRLWKCLGNG